MSTCTRAAAQAAPQVATLALFSALVLRFRYLHAAVLAQVGEERDHSVLHVAFAELPFRRLLHFGLTELVVDHVLIVVWIRRDVSFEITIQPVLLLTQLLSRLCTVVNSTNSAR